MAQEERTIDPRAKQILLNRHAELNETIAKLVEKDQIRRIDTNGHMAYYLTHEGYLTLRDVPHLEEPTKIHAGHYVPPHLRDYDVENYQYEYTSKCLFALKGDNFLSKEEHAAEKQKFYAVADQAKRIARTGEVVVDPRAKYSLLEKHKKLNEALTNLIAEDLIRSANLDGKTTLYLAPGAVAALAKFDFLNSPNLLGQDGVPAGLENRRIGDYVCEFSSRNLMTLKGDNFLSPEEHKTMRTEFFKIINKVKPLEYLTPSRREVKKAANQLEQPTREARTKIVAEYKELPESQKPLNIVSGVSLQAPATMVDKTAKLMNLGELSTVPVQGDFPQTLHIKSNSVQAFKKMKVPLASPGRATFLSADHVSHLQENHDLTQFTHIVDLDAFHRLLPSGGGKALDALLETAPALPKKSEQKREI